MEKLLFTGASGFLGKNVKPLLEGKSISYRSLSVRPHFKLIYYVNEARAELHIVDFWDMRRDTARLVDDLDV